MSDKAASIAAIGLVLLLSIVAYAQQPEADSGQSPASGGHEPAQYDPPTLPIYIVESEAEAQTRQRAEERSEQRELDDLAAQKGMEEAALKMADYSLYQTVLVGAGTVLLFVTLGLTWQANRAAQSAVEITERIGKKQVRAYLSVTSVGFAEGGPDDLLKAIVVFNNTGQSPAYQVHMEAVVGGKFNSGDQSMRVPEVVPGLRPSRFTIPAGHPLANRIVGAQPIRPADMSVREAIEQGFFEVVVWGWIKYEDVFGDQHTTKFNWFFDLNSMTKSESFRPDEYGNEAD